MDIPAASSLQSLPKVHDLLQSETAHSLSVTYGRTRVRDLVRSHLTSLRQEIIAQQDSTTAQAFDFHTFWASLQHTLQTSELRTLQRAINATGIVIHTNMGRAPLAQAALDAVREAAQGYSNLELDLSTGKRGGRGGLIAERLQRLTGAPSAIVVNNCAAALTLALAALAAGGDVVISRGELVEIGGGFRIPEVITQSGARLVEVGTTNKTRVSDYARAITPDTRALLKIHASNYKMVGFVSDVSLTELTELGRAHGLLVIEDLGSGALIDLSKHGLPPEPTVADAVHAGADIVAFSGDKLLGGPQCGVLVGSETAVAQAAAHPLFRALRADKMTLAALGATLRLYEEGALHEIPVLRMLLQSPEDLLKRARRLRRALGRITSLEARTQPGAGFSGGGTLPEEKLPTQLVQVRVQGMTVDCVAAKLRQNTTPVVGRVTDGWFVMDVRTITDSDIRKIVQAFEVLCSRQL